MLDPNALIYILYARVNCLKTIPFTVARTYIAHTWQYPLKEFCTWIKKSVVYWTVCLVIHWLSQQILFNQYNYKHVMSFSLITSSCSWFEWCHL